MEKNAAVRTAIAAGVAGLGLSVGGVALATAADPGGTSVAGAPADERGPGGRHGAMAAELAEALGLSEEKVTAALEAVRDELRPERRADGERPAPPTEEERTARQAAFAKALAEELGISADKVTAALEKLKDERAAEGRTRLEERLDTAVEDGDLTAADKASVLKAYDAGVLGGPGHGPGLRGR